MSKLCLQLSLGKPCSENRKGREAISPTFFHVLISLYFFTMEREAHPLLLMALMMYMPAS